SGEGRVLLVGAGGAGEVVLQGGADGERLLAQPAGRGEAERLLHEPDEVGLPRPVGPVGVDGAGQEDDPAAVGRHRQAGPLAGGALGLEGGQGRLPLDDGGLAGGGGGGGPLGLAGAGGGGEEGGQLARRGGAARRGGRQLGADELGERRRQQPDALALQLEGGQGRHAEGGVLGTEVEVVAGGGALAAEQPGRQQPLAVAVEHVVVGR